MPSPSFKIHQVLKPVRAERRAGHRHGELGVAVLGSGGAGRTQKTLVQFRAPPAVTSLCSALCCRRDREDGG